MEETTPTIPVLDCSVIGLSADDETVKLDDLKKLGEQLVDACASVGVCYLENHGVSQDMIDSYMAAAGEFFAQPSEVKEKYKRLDGKICGWVGAEAERLNPTRPAGDLKEAFAYYPEGEEEELKGDTVYPNGEFIDSNRELFEVLKRLALKLCDCLSLGLGLDESFMRDAHKHMGSKESTTSLRTLFYPAILDASSVKPGQIRLGEHTDYGTITLLCQDDIGGLEVEIADHGFVPVTPRPGTIVLNIGGSLQRWTSDRLVAVNHRVVIPESELRRRTRRQSVVYFVLPDNDCVIRPLDGSDKYPPITGMGYLMERIDGTGFVYSKDM